MNIKALGTNRGPFALRSGERVFPVFRFLQIRAVPFFRNRASRDNGVDSF